MNFIDIICTNICDMNVIKCVNSKTKVRPQYQGCLLISQVCNFLRGRGLSEEVVAKFQQEKVCSN